MLSNTELPMPTDLDELMVAIFSHVNQQLPVANKLKNLTVNMNYDYRVNRLIGEVSLLFKQALDRSKVLAFISKIPGTHAYHYTNRSEYQHAHTTLFNIDINYWGNYFRTAEDKINFMLLNPGKTYTFEPTSYKRTVITKGNGVALL